jgi:hypothetical protein
MAVRHATMARAAGRWVLSESSGLAVEEADNAAMLVRVPSSFCTVSSVLMKFVAQLDLDLHCTLWFTILIIIMRVSFR